MYSNAVRIFAAHLAVIALVAPRDIAPLHAALPPATRVTVAETRNTMTDDRVHHIAHHTVWRADRVHELDGPVVVDAGATLVIEAGTRVEARPGAFIDVTRDGRVVAMGTALQPIVLTCTSVPKYEGCWGGLTLRGAAEINYGTTTSPPARGSGAAGCRESGSGDTAFGGCDAADSSGVLRYVRVEHAALGLQLLGVGDRTVIDLVQVNRSLGDGMTIVGGSVDVRQLFLTANKGYGLSWRGGWRGRGQYIAVQQDQFGNAGGISGSNEGATPSAFTGEPRSAPTLLNVTVISPFAAGNPATGDAPAALHLRRGTGGVFRNLLIHSAAIALDIDDTRTCAQTAGTPPLTITNVVVANTPQLGNPDADPLSCEPYASPDVEREWLEDAANDVALVTDPAVSAQLVRLATNLILPDLRPAIDGATTTTPAATPPVDGFFVPTATFIGAVAANLPARNEIPWYSGWTVPAPLPPAPGTVTGTVTLAGTGPLADIVVRAALGVETVTSPAGSYSLTLPAGAHLLTANNLPIGCGSAPSSVSVASGAAATADFSVLCNSVTNMAVGALHGCALASTGFAQCWGNNEYGMVGDGTSVSPRTTPVLVAGNNVFELSGISSGYTHSCALRTGRAACWGLNFFGALGIGTVGFSAPAPISVGNSGTPSFVQVVAGGYHGCGLTGAGAVWCWGWNQESQAGVAATFAVATPVQAATGALVFTALTAGESHTCGLTASGEAWCWGGNGLGELGTDPAVVGLSSVSPVLVPGGHVFARLDAGALHTCGVTTTGEAYCWGSREYGQLGDGVTGGSSNGPVLVSGGALYQTISAGGHSTCAVTTSGGVHCWGAGVSGVLGNGTTPTAQSTPTPISGTLLAAGVNVNLSDPAGATACAWTTAGTAFCWGAGAAGQLGNGGLVSSSVPVQVLIRGPE